MSDNVLNNYVDSLLNINIEDENFEQYIDIFSKFLGYVNSDYKYNGTYLSQYVFDFKQVCQKLRIKNERYQKVFHSVRLLLKEFELTMDKVFYGKCCYQKESSKQKSEQRYIEINKDKIMNDSIEIQLILKNDEKEYLFCKEYDEPENDLCKKICEDIKVFIDMKGLGGSNNVTT